jgi:hypothetical protein
MPMHELVPSNLQTRLLARLRRFSFAGDGLPERMRSTAFAFLGLTAAAGLALVAIFAQLSFPLLSPAPLPNEPADGSAVSKAVALERSPGAFERANPGASPSGYRIAGGDAGDGLGSGGGGTNPEPTSVSPPASPAPAPGGGTSGGEAVETPTASPSPAPAPSSDPAQDKSAATAAPTPAPAPKPTPTPARPATPTPPPAPGNSQSSAAATHASERGVEASSKPTLEATASGAATSGTSSPEASSGNGNGKALGHSK